MVFKHGDIEFGDNVRIVDDDATRLSGHANLTGACYGMTMPTATGVEVIGAANEDVALNVHFEVAEIPDAWFAPHLVALVDRAIGTRATVGDQSFVKGASGWEPAKPEGARRRWFRRPT